MSKITKRKNQNPISRAIIDDGYYKGPVANVPMRIGSEEFKNCKSLINGRPVDYQYPPKTNS